MEMGTRGWRGGETSLGGGDSQALGFGHVREETPVRHPRGGRRTGLGAGGQVRAASPIQRWDLKPQNIHKKTCTWMLTTDRKCQRPKCPLVTQWINKTHFHPVEFHASRKGAKL